MTRALVIFITATALYAVFGPAPTSSLPIGVETTIVGTVTRPPEIRGAAQVLILKTVEGRVQIRAGRFPEYRYGDELRVRCTLGAADSFLYPQKVFVTCPFPKTIDRIGAHGNPLVAAVYNVKNQLTKNLDRALPPAEAGLAAGLLFGDRDLPPRDYANFISTGTSHVIAVSGYNVSIITTYVFSLLLLATRRRHRAIILLALFLVGYVVATGATASVVRAAIMASIPFVAAAFGRATDDHRLLLLTASVMLLINQYLFFDLGFLLSFAAILGLMTLAPALQERFRVPLKTSPPIIRSVMNASIQTFSAVLATLPIILVSFGRISLVAPLANIFILFAVPGAMLTGFLASIITIPLVGPLVSFIALILQRYILLVADLFARIPHASIVFRSEASGTYAAVVTFLFLLIAPSLSIAALRRIRRRRAAHASLHSPTPFTLAGWRVVVGDEEKEDVTVF